MASFLKSNLYCTEKLEFYRNQENKIENKIFTGYSQLENFPLTFGTAPCFLEFHFFGVRNFSQSRNYYR